MAENQVQPQLAAHDMRAEGHDVDVVFVSTGENAKGTRITCVLCGRTAMLPSSVTVPEGKQPICPLCIHR